MVYPCRTHSGSDSISPFPPSFLPSAQPSLFSASNQCHRLQLGLSFSQNGRPCSLKGNQTLYCGVSPSIFKYLVAFTPISVIPSLHSGHLAFWLVLTPTMILPPSENITCYCPFRLQSFYPGVLKAQVAPSWRSLPGPLLLRPSPPAVHWFHFPCSYFSIKPITSQHIPWLQFSFHIWNLPLLSPHPLHITLTKRYGLSFWFSLIFSNPSTLLLINCGEMPFTISWSCLCHVIPSSYKNVMCCFPYTMIKTSLCSCLRKGRHLQIKMLIVELRLNYVTRKPWAFPNLLLTAWWGGKDEEQWLAIPPYCPAGFLLGPKAHIAIVFQWKETISMSFFKCSHY